MYRHGSFQVRQKVKNQEEAKRARGAFENYGSGQAEVGPIEPYVRHELLEHNRTGSEMICGT